MLVKTDKTTKSGRAIYRNALTGQESPLPIVGAKKQGRIPDGILNRFIFPQMSKMQIQALNGTNI